LMRLTHPEAHCPALDLDKLASLNATLKQALAGKVFTASEGIEMVGFFGKPAKHTFWALVRFPTDRSYSHYAREFKRAMGFTVWRIDEEAALDLEELIPFFEEDLARLRIDSA